MTLTELNDLFEATRRRCHLVGSNEAGVIIGLDLEGRLFTGLGGRVLNRVNAEALKGSSTAATYLNPGGDGLWPAPEGSTLGYEYSTGAWRVPPGLTAARYQLIDADERSAKVRAEVDLINDAGLGLPTAFERHVTIDTNAGHIAVTVTECIEYLGRRKLDRDTALIAPWSLCQFDSGPGCEVRFPDAGRGAVWDLYDPSDSQRVQQNNLWITRTEGGPRYQLGLGKGVGWIEFRDPRHNLVVRRTAEPLPEGQDYVDIADRPPDHPPEGLPVRFSVYSDPECFMEIEAAGGCPKTLTPGARMAVTITTDYALG